MPLKLVHSVSDITATMRASILFSRWSRRSTLLASSSLRVEVCPPSLCHAPANLWQRVMFWMLAPAPQDAAPPLNGEANFQGRSPTLSFRWTSAFQGDVPTFDCRGEPGL